MLSVTSRAARACLVILALAVAPASPAAWRWLDPSGQGNRVSQMLYTQGHYLTIDARGGMLVSDGAWHWQLAREGSPTDSVNDAVLSGSAIVTVGDQGKVLYTPDGTHWQNIATPSTENLYGVAAGPPGYVAVGGLDLLRSSDGLTWTLIDTGLEPGFFGPRLAQVAYGAGRYVIWVDPDVIGFAAPADVLTSTDGITWTKTAVHLPGDLDQSPVFLRSMDFLGGRFVATCTSAAGMGLSLTSTDGLAWTAGTPPELSGGPVYFRGVAFDAANQRYLALNDVNDPPMPRPSYPLLMTSTDGLTWSNPRLVDRLPFDAIAMSNEHVFGLSSPGGAIHELAADGTWQERRALPRAWQLSDVATAGTRLIAVGNGPTQVAVPPYIFNDIVPALVTSPDGEHWTRLPIDSTVVGGTLSAVSVGAGAVVAIGQETTDASKPVAYVSYDNAQSWARATLPAQNEVVSLVDVAFAGGRFVALAGSTGEQHGVYVSTDGAHTWQFAQIDQSALLMKIVASGNGFIALADFGDVIYQSADGVAWTAVPTNSGAHVIASAAVHGGRYAALASNFTSNGSEEHLLLSTNGQQWQVGTNAPAGLIALDADATGFIGLTRDGQVLTSSDAVTWAGAWTGAIAQPSAAVRRANGDLLVVNTDGGILTGADEVLFRDGFD